MPRPARKLTEEDRADIEYLRAHRVAETLEAVTNAILVDKPERPLDTIVAVLKDMRIQHKAKQIENFMGTQHAMTADAKGEVDRQVGAIVSLERDESIKSESSTFSINSLDMAEFIAEFRQAYHQLSKTRVLNGRVSKDDLGDVIDLVAFPTPEKILTEMFSEVDLEQKGTVDFEECLARMTFKIQGRFHRDCLRAIYASAASAGAAGEDVQTRDASPTTGAGLHRSDEDVAGGLPAAAACGVLSRLLGLPQDDAIALLERAGIARDRPLSLDDFVRAVYVHTGHEDHLPYPDNLSE